ncbi:hypothetical protein EDB89DRAFT_1235203 [Lactarius sanguifluus]|nr:hypothetical protein EDB89DRAFT_1235203 [Lactarius sanguifluus]
MTRVSFLFSGSWSGEWTREVGTSACRCFAFLLLCLQPCGADSSVASDVMPACATELVEELHPFSECPLVKFASYWMFQDPGT